MNSQLPPSRKDSSLLFSFLLYPPLLQPPICFSLLHSVSSHLLYYISSHLLCSVATQTPGYWQHFMGTRSFDVTLLHVSQGCGNGENTQVCRHHTNRGNFEKGFLQTYFCCCLWLLLKQQVSSRKEFQGAKRKCRNAKNYKNFYQCKDKKEKTTINKTSYCIITKVTTTTTITAINNNNNKVKTDMKNRLSKTNNTPNQQQH